jgi:hypothetical protein
MALECIQKDTLALLSSAQRERHYSLLQCRMFSNLDHFFRPVTYPWTSVLTLTIFYIIKVINAINQRYCIFPIKKDPYGFNLLLTGNCVGMVSYNSMKNGTVMTYSYKYLIRFKYILFALHAFAFMRMFFTGPYGCVVRKNTRTGLS